MITILCSIILILGVFLVIICLCEDYTVHHMALNCALNLDDCAAGPLLLQLVPPDPERNEYLRPIIIPVHSTRCTIVCQRKQLVSVLMPSEVVVLVSEVFDSSFRWLSGPAKK